MAFTNRIALIKKIEELRQSTVICYLTSVRPNLSANMSDERRIKPFLTTRCYCPNGQ